MSMTDGLKSKETMLTKALNNEMIRARRGQHCLLSHFRLETVVVKRKKSVMDNHGSQATQNAAFGISRSV
jgi:hypothetical protein